MFQIYLLKFYVEFGDVNFEFFCTFANYIIIFIFMSTLFYCYCNHILLRNKMYTNVTPRNIGNINQREERFLNKPLL